MQLQLLLYFTCQYIHNSAIKKVYTAIKAMTEVKKNNL